jgi:hypothetical protein
LTVDLWWAPLPLTTAQWNNAATGAFKSPGQGGSDTNSGLDPNFATDIQPEVLFRLFDEDSSVAYATYLRGGSVCLSSLQIDRWDFSQMTDLGADFEIGNTTKPFAEAPLTGSPGSGGTVSTKEGDTLGTWSIVYNASDGSMTITPTGSTAALAANGLQYVHPQVGSMFPSAYNLPSTDTTAAQVDSYYSTLPNSFPITWKADTLYEVTLDIKGTDANNPPDYVVLGVGQFTNELDMISYCADTAGDYIVATGENTPGPGAPNATAATYRAFWYSHTPTLGYLLVNSANHSVPGFQTWQPYFYVTETAAGFGRAGNKTGGVTISNLSVHEVTFP